MGKIYLSEFNTLYSRLNSVRAGHNLSAINRAPVSGIARISSMDTLRTDLSNTSSSSDYIPNSNYSTEFSAVSVGAYIQQVTLSNIQGILTTIESVCVHNSAQYSANYGDHVDRDRDSDCSTNRSSYNSSDDSDLGSFNARDGVDYSSKDNSNKQYNGSW